MQKIAVYTGKGAYMAKEIEAFLTSYDFDYDRLNEYDIKKNDLKKYNILIIGGGAIYKFLPALGKKGINQIRNFIKLGGKYIGICAGAYIAAANITNSKGRRQQGLNLVNTTFLRGHGERVVKVNFKFCKEKIKLFYCSGPLIKKLGKDDILIAADQSGKYGIIRKDYGKGLIYLFTAHPEGNLYRGITSKTLGADLFLQKLLGNVKKDQCGL